MSTLRFYNWDKIFSYNAPLNLIVTARGKGKTYGFRKQAIKDYLKDGSRFCEIVRYNKQIKDVVQGYFDKLQLNGEFPKHVFKCEGDRLYIAPATEKPKWELLGYCISLNDQQNAKKKTYANVRRCIFDEYILEQKTHAGYLPDEYGKLVNLFNTIAREDPTIDYTELSLEELLKQTKVRFYLCANACDLINPYFSEFGLNDAPKKGFTWLEKGLVLLHYDDDKSYSDSMRKSLVGRLTRSHNAGMYTNEFSNTSNDFVAKKPKDAKFIFAFVYKEQSFGVWVSYNAGYFYINRKIPSDATDIYALTRDDNSPNLLMAKRTSRKMQTLLEMFYNGSLRYDSPATRGSFENMLSLFGVR